MPSRRQQFEKASRASGPRSAKGKQGLLAQTREALQQGDILSAEVLCGEVLRRFPRDAEAIGLRAELHARRGQFRKAADLLRPVAIRRSRDFPLQFTWATCLRRAGLPQQASEVYEKLLRLKPDDVAVVGGLCTCLVMIGQRDRAKQLLTAQFAAKRATPSMSVTLVRAFHDGDEFNEAVRAANEHLERTDLHETHRRRLHSLRGRALEKLGRFDDAMSAYCKAADFERVPFDRRSYSAEIDALIRFFDQDWFRTAPRAAASTEEPVFIVGMPRSGSTLLERVLASHPQVRAVGEHPAMYEMLERMKTDLSLTGEWPDRLRSLSQEQLERYAQEYVSDVRREIDGESQGFARIVDKALWNTHALGVIAMMFPGARVIWSRRNPEDACVSCFAESFEPRMAPYASDLANLGFVHRELDRLMLHWKNVLPIPIYLANYEHMIDQQEDASRGLVEFVGLPWHDDCLAFHRAAGHADTISHEQVRRPIYRSSLARGERYSRYLEPLRAELAKGPAVEP